MSDSWECRGAARAGKGLQGWAGAQAWGGAGSTAGNGTWQQSLVAAQPDNSTAGMRSLAKLTRDHLHAQAGEHLLRRLPLALRAALQHALARGHNLRGGEQRALELQCVMAAHACQPRRRPCVHGREEVQPAPAACHQAPAAQQLTCTVTLPARPALRMRSAITALSSTPA